MAKSAHDVDIDALAAIRPGAPIALLGAAYGSRWRPPAPHGQGWVDVIENSHHFKARLDVNGIVGEVVYLRLFPESADIDGLRMSMPIEEARLARPDIKVGAPLVGGPPLRLGSAEVSDRDRLLVQFGFGEVREIRFTRRGAVFPSKQAIPYPMQAGPAGHPFVAPNLKLAVLSELLDAKAIELGTPADLATHVLQRPVDLEKEGYDLIHEAYDYLVRYPLTDEHLNSVTQLVFDGGSTIYPYAYYFWGGETDEFDVTSLAGLDRCPNLISLDIISMVTGPVDVKHLLRLPKLETVMFGGVEVLHPEAMLALPRLKAVDRFTDDTELLDVLRGRGVKLR